MAAKRHHASRRARHDEHMGTERYERGTVKVGHMKDHFNDELHHDRDGYEMAMPRGENYFPTMSGQGRRALEKPEMIYEDNRAIANLPQEVMIKPYPRTGPYMPEDLDDTQRGVNEQMDYDDKQRASHFYPKKV